ncbi:MAG TPA: alpha/beta hydrolase [Vicinamibacterales bacterium]|nr:alpha/beta hydrolase [Vicinamibacterales bacterium]
MDRRTFIRGTTSIALAAATRRLTAQAAPAAEVQTVRTGVLEIGYYDVGSRSGFPVILLHGFPDDAHAYDDVAPQLAQAGFRAIAVFLRGFGVTRFLDAGAPRTAEQAAIGQDVLDFADALQLPRFAVCGYDWGGRAAAVAAVLQPARVRAAALIGGYSIQNTVTRAASPTPEAARRLWYQWYLNTPAGRDGLAQDRRSFCRLLWREWSPTWPFSDDMFNRTAVSFDNPDFVDCVVHSYRHRNFNAAGERRFEDVERMLATRPPLRVPTMLLHGGDDALGRVQPEVTAAERATLPGLVGKRIVAGAGHFVPHEKPAVVASALLDLLAASS